MEANGGVTRRRGRVLRIALVLAAASAGGALIAVERAAPSQSTTACLFGSRPHQCHPA